MPPATNDLSNLLAISDKPVSMPLEHPFTFEPMVDELGNPSTISVWGPDSAVMKKVEQEISHEMMDIAMRSRGKSFKPDTEKHARKRFLARIDGWENLTLGGGTFPYTAENKARIFDDPAFGPVKTMFESTMNDPASFLAKKG